MPVDPRLLAAIRSQPAYLQEPLLTTALVESGGNPLVRPGDGGESWGAYQEYTGGRGSGLSPAQRQDPVGSTQRAAREFQVFYGRGARGASLAYRAQRPADQSSYMQKYNQLVGQARSLLSGSGGAGPSAPGTGGASALSAPGGTVSGGAGQITHDSTGQPMNPHVLRQLRAYMSASEADVAAGRPVRDVSPYADRILKAMERGRVTIQQPALQQPAIQAQGTTAPTASGAAGSWYRGELDKIPNHPIAFGADPSGGYGWADQLAKKFGLTVTSGYRNAAQQIATGSRAGLGSRHLTRGAAADISGSPDKMRALADWAIRSGRYAEVFFDPLGQWDNGRFSRQGIGGHSDHVHLSYGNTN